MTPLSYKPRVRGGNEKVSHKSRHRVISRHREAIQGANLEAALLVLADIDAHGGPEAGLVRWARLVIGRGGLSGEIPKMPEQRELFMEVA